MTKDDINKKTEELASRVMSLSAGTLLLNMRFLAKSINRLPVFSGGEGLSCNGRRIIYEPRHMLKRYKQDPRLPVHDYLHMIMHCIFRHWLIGTEIRSVQWDIACDITVEALIMKIGADFCTTDKQDQKSAVIQALSLNVKPFTAEKIYFYFVKNNISDDVLKGYRQIFAADDHSCWHKSPEREYEPEESQNVIGLGYPENEPEKDPLENQNENSSGEEDNKAEGESSNYQSGELDSVDDKQLKNWLEENKKLEMKQLEELWKEISKEILSELENFDKKAGSESGLLTDAIRYVNRDRCDYMAFLRKFAVWGEQVKPDLDSMDYNFYSYGLSIYGNVALVEPLEYKEEKLVRDFVIAVDTSGSVDIELARNFISKTYSILKNEESFFTKVNIYIIQCDTEVREAVKIACKEDFERYLDDIQIKGLGGTNFRAVFDYVDTLIKNHEFTFLKGLIYFTDGLGEFPESKPDYDTAFAFMRTDYENNGQPSIPPWAIKLILEEEDFYYG